MNNLDDYQLGDDAPEQEIEARDGLLQEPGDEPPDGRSDGDSRRRLLIVVAVLVALALALFGWFWSRRSTTSAPSAAAAGEELPASQSTAPSEEESATEVLELPALDASDVLVRELAATLSANPTLASWLVNDDLVRRFVVAVDNVAEGQAPKTPLGFLAPKAPFRAMESGGRLLIDPAGYRRFDAAVEVFTSLDSEGSVELYRRLKPLIDSAYRDLGYPDYEFEDTLRQAVDVVLRTPSPARGLELEPGVRSYKFAEERLESLEPAQKQLLRLGPDNLAKVQTKIRAMLQVLDAAPATESG